MTRGNVHGQEEIGRMPKVTLPEKEEEVPTIEVVLSHEKVKIDWKTVKII